MSISLGANHSKDVDISSRKLTRKLLFVTLRSFFDTPKPVDKDLKTKWCLDDTPPEPAETYDEAGALGDPIGTAQSQPVASYLPANTPFVPQPAPTQNNLPSYGAQPQYQG